ncbi:hypothetical protein Nepgr_009776 [Nepenthes gracilis]|uniref:Uncharacterized protein n=1 Tax=Nepenthes gracilis TaxID=150966 RepID=A0AAD3XKR3_NEPGR|nr:hypothetical protein Nepgr_009776 [Nepenthes gracilis]
MCKQDNMGWDHSDDYIPISSHRSAISFSWILGIDGMNEAQCRLESFYVLFHHWFHLSRGNEHTVRS